VEKGCRIAVCQMVTAAFDVQLSVNINRKQYVEGGGDKNAENLCLPLSRLRGGGRTEEIGVRLEDFTVNDESFSLPWTPLVG
jgi:hypothetical protein